MRKLCSTVFMLCLLLMTASAQQKNITGKILDAESRPVTDASITVKGTSGGTTSDKDGAFSIPVNNGARLVISAIGYTSQEVIITNQTTLSIVLVSDSKELEDVVVTGVAQATSRKNLAFAVTKVNEALINTVPALDLSQTLRGKVAGITIYQTEGDGAANVFLRGAKSLFGNISPLIVIDGYVSSLGLGDLNPQDVESMEVIKGAAAAALYGTRAEGGVIQVITKKGKNSKDKLTITIDNEYGINNVQRTPKLATQHRWKTDPNDEFGFAYQPDPVTGNPTVQRIANYESNGFSSILSPYKTYYDNVDALMGDRNFYTNFVSLANSGDKYNVYLSFQNQTNAGVLEPIKSNIRRTAKLNLQLRPTKKWELETNLHYFYNSRPSDIASGGGQQTFFANILQQEPFINLNEKDANGNYVAVPRGHNIQGSNLNFNPLYQYSQIKYKNYSNEILAGGKAKYYVLQNLSVEVLGSINQTFSNGSTLYPKGYQTAVTSETLNNGNLAISSSRSQFINGQAQINYSEKFGDFNFSASAKSVYEYYYNQGFSASGFNFTVPLYILSNTQAANRTISGSDEKTGKTVNYGYFLNLRTSYQDKLFLDVLGRLDQSSRYGRDEQTAFFPRVSGAYRITKDFDLGKNVNELKVRASWGQAGRVPGFNAKESLASVSNTGISISQNENTDLKRSSTSELEVGFDATFFKKLDVTFNYANANSKNDFVRPPVFIPSLGTTPAYKNFGLINSYSIELETRANAVVDKRNVVLDLGLTFARTRSKIKDLGVGLPPFIDGLYYKDVNLSPYAFYGHKILTSLSELTVNEDKFVTNAAGGVAGTTRYTIDDFVVNRHGHVVLKSALGTASEVPLVLQENGASKSVVIGDGQPDFVVGFNTTLTLFKKLQLYATLDWQQGGNKYSQTTQYLTFDDRTMIWQQYTQAGLPQGYISALYNGNSYTSVWLEDNSYLSLREIALSYTLPKIKGFQALSNARIALVGRNLYTWSKFSGSNPEGYYEYFPYPVFRNYTVKLTLNF